MNDTTRSPSIYDHPTAKLSELGKKEKPPVGKGQAPFLSRHPFYKTGFWTKRKRTGEGRERGPRRGPEGVHGRKTALSLPVRIGEKARGRGSAHSLLVRIGVLLAILIVLSLVGMAIRATITFQDITAFQVGVQKAVPFYIGGGGSVYPRQQLPVSYAAA